MMFARAERLNDHLRCISGICSTDKYSFGPVADHMGGHDLHHGSSYMDLIAYPRPKICALKLGELASGAV